MKILRGMMACSLALLLLAACGGEEAPPAESEPQTEIAESEPVEEQAPEPTVEEPTEAPTEIPPTATPVPTATPEPTPTPEPIISEPVFYSNGNYVQDAIVFDGTLWTAGGGGLTAYDIATGEGRKYTHFDGLPNVATYNFTTCPINGEERLIVGFHEGVLLYDGANDSWESGSTIGVTVEDRIFDIHCDAATGRLFLDYSDMLIVDLATGTQTQLDQDEAGLASFTFDDIFQVGADVWATSFQGATLIQPDNSIQVLGEDQGTWPSDDITDAEIAPDGTLWITAGEGIYQQTGSGLSPDAFTLFDKDNSDGISFFGPDYIEFTADGQLWAAFNSDICQFNPDTGFCDVEWDVTDLGLDPAASIRGFDIFEDGTFLVHTLFHGTALYDGSTWTAYTLDGQAPHNWFEKFIQTSDGTIWSIGWNLVYTDVDAEVWTQPEGLFAEDLVEAADGTLWLASGRRIQQFNGQQIFEYTVDENGLLDESIEAIEITSDGTVYAGGYNGYSVLAPDGTATAVGEAAGWEIGNIRDLLVVDDVVYAATTEGLVQLDGATWTSIIDESFIAYGSNSTAVLGVLENGSESLGLPAGTLLLGTSDGLLYWDGTNLTADPVATGSINSLFVDQESGEIYATSFWNLGNDEGYFYYSPADGWAFTPAEEFPGEYMLGVFKDDQGSVWISSGDSTWGGGIVRLP